MPRTLSEKMPDALQWAVSFSGVCFRCVPLKFANAQDIISGKGSIAYGGRFNFIGKFEVHISPVTFTRASKKPQNLCCTPALKWL